MRPVAVPADLIAPNVRGAVGNGFGGGFPSTWLWHTLRGSGLPAVCVDVREAGSGLDMRVKKTDRDDATGPA